MTVIGIIESDKKLSDSYERYLGKQLGIEKIVMAGGINEFLERGIREINHPDVILFDLDLPGHYCVEEIPFLRQHFAEAKLVVNSVKNDFELVRKALNYGAAGYLCKPISPPLLLQYLSRVVDDGVVLCPETERKLVNFFSEPAKPHYGSLTQQEFQIINGLTKGRSYKDLASDLDISINTVRFHIKNVYRKMKVSNRAELFRKVYNASERKDVVFA